MKKYLIVVAIIIVALAIALLKLWPLSLESDTERIRAALASKHSLAVSEIADIHIEENSGQFAWGQAGLGTGPGSGTVFFAAKQNGTWLIVADGNGIPDCTNFDTYKYPREMFGSCVESDGELREAN